MKLRPWMTAVLFCVGVGGSAFMLILPVVRPNVEINPSIVTIFAGIVGFVVAGGNKSDDDDKKKETSDER